MFLLEFDACDPAAAKAARTTLIAYLEREIQPRSDVLAVEEIFGELVTNVCAHAGRWARASLTWQRDGYALLEVSDFGPGLDLTQWRAPGLSEHGRGLMIVTGLCRQVSIMPGEGGRGTRVRATLPVRRRLVAA